MTPRVSLVEAHPRLACELDPGRNAELDPSTVSRCSRRRVWWLCARGHSWESRIDNRVAGGGCPFCSGRRVEPTRSLAALHPE
ncbi:MAG: zinc-ribbon domain-containing protein, partial [Gaiellaceae bacterium]